MLLAVPYTLAGIYYRAQVEAGGPGWLILLVLLFLFNTLKFVLIGPISLMKLIVVRVREAVARRRMTRALLANSAERFDEPVLVSRRS
ncbi:hypothetical protein [Cryobacterium sp. N19]|uniref:hypothetical protein n=1 Tax=Cryobacterium sp. N19 TaxID=2048288 RepID=UPI003515EC65